MAWQSPISEAVIGFDEFYTSQILVSTHRVYWWIPLPWSSSVYPVWMPRDITPTFVDSRINAAETPPYGVGREFELFRCYFSTVYIWHDTRGFPFFQRDVRGLGYSAMTEAVRWRRRELIIVMLARTQHELKKNKHNQWTWLATREF